MSSMLFKAKKFVASKMSETKSGRSLIVSHFGEAGDTIVTMLKFSARKFSDVKGWLFSTPLSRDVWNSPPRPQAVLL